MLKILLLLLISSSASAAQFKFERSDLVIQKEIGQLELAIRSDQRAHLPPSVILHEGSAQAVPERANCEASLDRLYINSALEINRNVLDMMGHEEFRVQKNGCSHRIALILALEKVLPNFYISKKRDVEKRHFSVGQMTTISKMIDDIIHSTHTALARSKLEVTLYPIDSDEYFLVSNFKMSRLIGKQRYRIGVNPKVFALDIPKKALKGVLAHELQHTEDYATGSFVARIVPIGIKLLMKKYRYRYERQTDLKAVLKGYGRELIAYKRWQYRFLSPADLVVKRQNYLTPGEIEIIMQQLPHNIARVKEALHGRMPKNIEEWNEFFN